MRVQPFVAALLAGLSGTLAHLALMSAKSALHLMPDFQPYEALQTTLNEFVGRELPASVLWLLSWLNGAILVGFVFARIWRRVPGRSGFVKGILFGIAAWLIMGLVIFPMIGLGLFGSIYGAQAIFLSAVMLLIYSATMGSAYGLLCAPAGASRDTSKP
jgi:hypothetical protein